MDFDLVIRGGTLVDGTGRDGVRGDLGIRRGTIAALGEAKGTAGHVIEHEAIELDLQRARCRGNAGGTICSTPAPSQRQLGTLLQ